MTRLGKKQRFFTKIIFFLMITVLFQAVNFSVLVGEAEAASLQAIISFDEPAWLNSTNGQSAIYPLVSTTKGYAPLPVLFQGFKSLPREEIVDYVWNFGDSSAYEGNPNIFHGLNAAHVYETPGDYTATLTVYDLLGNSESTSVKIQVLSPNGKTYWVDQNGNDAWTGLCQNPPLNPALDKCGPWRTGTKAFAGAAINFYQPGDQIIFKRGQIFEVNSDAVINHYKGGYGYTFRAASGFGAKPILQWTGDGSGSYMLRQLGHHWGHVGFVDLEVRLRKSDVDNSPNEDGFVYTAARGRSFLFLRMDFRQPQNSAVLIQGDTADSPSGAFLIDSTVINSKVYPETSIQFYFKGSNLAMLNNTFDLSGNHTAYLGKVDKGVIAGNIFSRPAFGRTALRISGVGGVADPSNNIQVSDNQMLGWIDPETVGSAHNGQGKNYHWRLVNLSPNVTGDQLIKDVIFERNILTNCNGCLSVANADNIIVRNNLFATPGNNKSIDRIEVGAKGSINHTLPVRNLKIIGNTFVSGLDSDSVTGTAFIRMINFDGGQTVLGTQHSGIEIANNIFYVKPGENGRLIRFDTNNADLIDSVVSDYNLYYLPDNKTLFEYSPCVGKTGGGWDCTVRVSDNLSDWRLRTGNDLHSNIGDPKFIATPTLVDHNAGHPNSLAAGKAEALNYINGLSLGAGSLAIDAGSNNYSGMLYYDFILNQRPQGNGVDVGAFESKLKGTSLPPRGEPKIEFISLPVYGDNSSSPFIAGKVINADVVNHKLAIYIKVAGVWYPKPNNQSLIDLAPDGSFKSWIMTIFSDYNATEIVAYLVPTGTVLPNCWPELCLAKPAVSEALATLSAPLDTSLSPIVRIESLPNVIVKNPYLTGRTTGVDPAQYKIMTYIKVGGVWYSKPNVDTLTYIAPDGTWYAYAITHQNDWQATDYKVFLVPNETDVPNYAAEEVRLDEPVIEAAPTFEFKSVDWSI